MAKCQQISVKFLNRSLLCGFSTWKFFLQGFRNETLTFFDRITDWPGGACGSELARSRTLGYYSCQHPSGRHGQSTSDAM